MASNILNKAKPKVAPPTPPKEEQELPAAAASSPGKEPAADKMEETAAPTVNGEQPQAAADTAVPAEMDVD